jgi:NAD(P)-dependent dehydrogenase (short-subunit alcohol dehydrogenase family)
MTRILVTGANKGLGRETARRLLAAGHDVWIGSRDRDRGMAAADELGGRFVELDVTDEASVQAAAGRLAAEGPELDALINNAAIVGGFKAPRDTTADDLAAVYATNILGVVRVTHAMLGLLENSQAPVIVNVSSGMGSLAVTTDPDRFESSLHGLAYPSSKAALNMITSQYAKAFPRLRINAVDPGYTATDLNGHRGTKTIEQGAKIIVDMATIGPDGPTGTFVDEHGTVPW